MNFAWIRFDSTNEECSMKLCNIKEKIFENGIPKTKPINLNDLKLDRWYFCQKNNEKRWSKINILYLGETEKEIKEKMEKGRKKYKSLKYFETDSSFEENQISITKMMKKEMKSKKEIASQDRAKTVLQNVHNNYVLPKYIDSDDSDIEMEKSIDKNYKLKEVSVSLTKMNSFVNDSQKSNNELQPHLSVISNTSKNENRSSQRLPTRSRSPLRRRASEENCFSQKSAVQSPSRSKLPKKSLQNNTCGKNSALRLLSPSRTGSRRNSRDRQRSPSRSRSRSRRNSRDRQRSPSRSKLPEKALQKNTCGKKSPSRLLEMSGQNKSPCQSPQDSSHRIIDRERSPLSSQSLLRDMLLHTSRGQQSSPSRSRSLSRSRSTRNNHNRQRLPSLSPSRSRSRSNNGDRQRSPSLSRSRFRSKRYSRDRQRSPSRSRSRSRRNSRDRRKSPSPSPSQSQSRSRSRRNSRDRQRSPSLPRSRSRSRRNSRDRQRSASRSRSRSRRNSRDRQRSASRSRSRSRRNSRDRQRSPSRSPSRSRHNSHDFPEVPQNNENNQRRRGGRRITVPKHKFILKCLEYYETSQRGINDRRKRYKSEDGLETYLGEGIYVGNRSWQLIQAHKPSQFLGELAVLIWKEENLCNRAFDLTRPVENIPGRSPVKLIENDLLRLLISLYDEFLKRSNYNATERVDLLLKSIYTLRHKIRDLRSAEKKRLSNHEHNPRRRLRYNII